MDFVKSQEYISAHRSEIIKDMCTFLQTDTLLFWSEKPDLFIRQQKYWQPILNSLNGVFKLGLQITTTLEPAKNASATKKIEQLFAIMSDKELTGCFLAAREMKSVFLGLLLINGKIDVSTAFNAAFLEELYQNQAWGEDVAALNAREKSRKVLKKITEYIK